MYWHQRCISAVYTESYAVNIILVHISQKKLHFMFKFLNKNSPIVQKSAGNIIQTPFRYKNYVIFLYTVKKR